MSFENTLEVASQSQCMLGQYPHCGDGVLSIEHAEGLFGLLCDGAGHGVEAERVQQQAIAFTQTYISSHTVIDLVDLFQGLHKNLKGSRGMVAVAFIWRANGWIDFVHMGDVSFFACPGKRSSGQPGVIGYQMPTPRLQRWEQLANQCLVAHSDGIPQRTKSEQWAVLLDPNKRLNAVMVDVMRSLAKGNDDACCLLAREKQDRSMEAV